MDASLGSLAVEGAIIGGNTGDKGPRQLSAVAAALGGRDDEGAGGPSLGAIRLTNQGIGDRDKLVAVDRTRELPGEIAHFCDQSLDDSINVCLIWKNRTASTGAHIGEHHQAGNKPKDTLQFHNLFLEPCRLTSGHRRRHHRRDHGHRRRHRDRHNRRRHHRHRFEAAWVGLH